VARIFCVGRNYAEHAAEMGHAVDREKPFYFCKSATALRQDGETLGYPPGTTNYHYEVELVVALGGPAYRTTREAALDAVYGYAVGLDMTRRDLQLSERVKQRPWTLGKDVEASAPVSAIRQAARIGHPRRGAIALRQNTVLRQNADIADLVWSVAEIIAHLSGFYHLGPGDLVFTGTPAGVGPVQPGDLLECAIAGVGELTVAIGQED
jgi:fumarylpyruvate hydrolase